MKSTRQLRLGFYRFLPWGRREINKAVRVDKVRNSLIGATYYLDMLLSSEEYGTLNFAQKELIHRSKNSIDEANHRLDDLFGTMNIGLASLAINEKQKEVGQEE